MPETEATSGAQKTLEQTHEFDIVKRAFGISIGLREK
jgi:hypothetical protein